MVLAALAPGPPELSSAPVYALAIAALVGTDFAQTVLRNLLLDRAPFMELARAFWGATRVELVLTPVALVATLAAYEEPLVLVAVIVPLVWLLDNFSKDRAARYAAALELNRAYRGTTMLLSDVLEVEDDTSPTTRGRRGAGNAVADELGIAAEKRKELEFGALLHDVGKIAIPKEILNKPGTTAREFEMIKTHTIEGQRMLDRVGGLLSESAESCAPVTSAGTARATRTGSRESEIPLELADRRRLRHLQRHDHRSALSRSHVTRRGSRRTPRATPARSSTRRSYRPSSRSWSRASP